MLDINKKPTDSDIKEWSEGNEYLEKLLIACREYGIPSMFCCAGHGKGSTAYIALEMNSNTIGKVCSIINCLSNTENISFGFSSNPFFSNIRFGVYMYDEDEKNKVMDTMTQAVSTDEKIEELPINYQKLLELIELLSNNKFIFDLLYYKFNDRKIYFRNWIMNNTKYPFESEIEKLGFTVVNKNKYYFERINVEEEQEILEKILNGMKNICNDLNKDFADNKKNQEITERD